MSNLLFTVEQLAAEPRLAADLDNASIASILRTCVAAASAALSRVLEITIYQASAAAHQPAGDSLINALEAARRLGISRSTFYLRARAGKYPFVLRDCGEIKASVMGLDKWIAMRARLQFTGDARRVR